MANDQVQQLYDAAFRHWQAKENDKAAELIDKALSLAPGNLSLHALAVHIKFVFHKQEHVPHAEFILDHDLHFRDLSDPHREPFRYVDLLFLAYAHAPGGDDEDEPDGDEPAPEGGLMTQAEADRRHCHYAIARLQAGYAVPHLSYFLDALSRLKRYDEVIDIGQCFVGLKSAEEIGLPGLDETEDDSDMFQSMEESVMRAFFRTGRDQEALQYCHELQESDPDRWYNHVMLAEVLCRLDRPVEAARQYIIAVQKGAHLDQIPQDLKNIADLVEDPQAGMKTALSSRIREVKDKVPPERKVTAHKVQIEVSSSIGQRNKPITQESFVEAKMGVALPALDKRHLRWLHRLWLPRNQGPHPFVEYRQAPADDTILVVPRSALSKPDCIERYGIDLTARAAAGTLPPIVGRDREINALIRILVRMEKNNAALIGEAGVGKTAIAQGLAQRIVSGDVPPFLLKRRVYELPVSALVAGTHWRGDFETRMTNILREARDNPDIILFIDELHMVMGAGAAGRGDLDVANMTKPALAKGELRLIGATTTKEYSRRIERDQAMARRFTPIRVAEMDRDSTIEVLRRRREHWRKFHHVEISDEVLTRAVEWTEAHVTNRKLPDKAIDLLDESCAHVRTAMSGDTERATPLTLDIVRRVLMEWTGAAGQTIALPPVITDDKTPQSAAALPARETLVESLREHIVAQDAAVDALAGLVAQCRLSLKEPTVPLVLVFYGPPGTGKTTAARALAGVLWPGDADRVIAWNMAEYSEPWSLNRLIGAPLGYTQHEEGGILTARLRRQPHSIFLLKQLDAAAPQVLGFFADLIRQGTYTDTLGRQVSAADALLIVHVNASDDQRQIGFPTAKRQPQHADRDQVLDELRHQGVADRFLCGVSGVLTFAPLSRETTCGVLRLRLNRLQLQFAQKSILLQFTDALIDRLSDQFLKLPAERRNVDALIDRQVTPLIRAALLSQPTPPPDKLVIDV